MSGNGRRVVSREFPWETLAEPAPEERGASTVRDPQRMARLRRGRRGRRRGRCVRGRGGWGGRQGSRVHARSRGYRELRLSKDFFGAQGRRPTLGRQQFLLLEEVSLVRINGSVNRVTAGQADGKRHEAQCELRTNWAGHSFLYGISPCAVNLRNEPISNQRRILPAASQRYRCHKTSRSGPGNDPW